MNVWMLNHYAGLPTTTPATRTFDLSKELVKVGHRVTVFACSFNHYSLAEEQLRPLQLFNCTELEGVHFVWIRGIPYQKNNVWRFLNISVYALFAFVIGLWLTPRPDIVIGTTVHPLAPVSAFFISCVRRARFWLDITDIWPQSLIDLGHLKPNGNTVKLLSALESFSLRHAEIVMSVLPNIATYLQDKGLGNKPTIWIPNGISADRIPSQVKPPLHIENSRFTVMYAGGFAPAHALEVVLQAASLIQSRGHNSSIRFILVGDGPEMGAVKSYIQKHRLKNVELPGFVAKSSLYDILVKADAFLVTGKNLSVYRYGISFNKLFDYLLASRPVIFALDSYNNPIADAGAGLTVDAENPEALAVAIIRLKNTPEGEKREMGIRGRQFVLSEFDYAVLAGRLETFFHKKDLTDQKGRST